MVPVIRSLSRMPQFHMYTPFIIDHTHTTVVGSTASRKPRIVDNVGSACKHCKDKGYKCGVGAGQLCHGLNVMNTVHYDFVAVHKLRFVDDWHKVMKSGKVGFDLTLTGQNSAG